MAVNIYAYRRNGLAAENDWVNPLYILELLNSIPLDEAEILNGYNYGFRPNNLIGDIEIGLGHSRWEQTNNERYFKRLILGKRYINIGIYLDNDLIRISGPSPVFSIYSTFLKTISNSAREYYHSYFKEICRVFKSDFILYAHEWSGLDDDDNEEFNCAMLMEQSGCPDTSSTSIHNMDRFYYEHL